MRHPKTSLLSSSFAFIALLFAGSVFAQAREEGKLMTATEVLDQLRDQRDNVIPDKILERAYGIAVIPDVVKGAFVVGGRHGTGVLVTRDKSGRFGSPVFISLSGGSVGWQIGVQETDVVLVFVNKRGIDGIADGKLTLGAGASVAAGPVGRQGEAAAGVNAEIYSYSRNRGLFAGVALDGTAILIDNSANAAFYKKRGVSAQDIMDGTVTSPSENVRKFHAAIAASTGEGAAAATTHTPATTAPAPAGGVQTFPMEDPKPGTNP